MVVYKKLAQRLDSIPNGFPPTESGAELRLLAKLYTEDEATLAAEMRLAPESASVIAKRAGYDPDSAYAILKQMARKGLIAAHRSKGGLQFSLMPFVVGIYEAQLKRMDEEMAHLFEEYFLEKFGPVVLSQEPSVHRVIPVEESIPISIEIFPYERASQILDQAKSFGVRDCVCRVQKRLLGESCDYPVETCILFAPIENAFARSSTTRPISKEQALRILRDCEEAGLVHSSGNYQRGIGYICNCCPCCCGIMRGITELGIANSMGKADFYAAVDPGLCVGCETCLDRCHFGALSITDGVCMVDRERCAGCGLCVSSCPEGALTLRRKPTEQMSPPPVDVREWLEERAKLRGIPLDDVL